MICRFCSQWNAESAQRCCFCGNLASAAADSTSNPRRTAAQQGLAGDPLRRPEVRPEDADLGRHGRQLQRAGVIWSVVVAIGFGLYLLVQFRCMG